MPTKIQPADAEEHVFVALVNKKLGGLATVSAFSTLDTESGERRHGLVLSCGSKRHTVMADTPFHYDPADDVVARVKHWLSGAGRERYTTDSSYA